jgi:hypothetical protein
MSAPDSDAYRNPARSRSAHAEVDRQPDHDGAGLFGEVGSAVGTGVVDDYAVVAEGGHRLHHLADASLLFEGRHHHDDFGHVVCSSS